MSSMISIRQQLWGYPSFRRNHIVKSLVNLLSCTIHIYFISIAIPAIMLCTIRWFPEMGVPLNHSFIVGFSIINPPFWVWNDQPRGSYVRCQDMAEGAEGAEQDEWLLYQHLLVDDHSRDDTT